MINVTGVERSDRYTDARNIAQFALNIAKENVLFVIDLLIILKNILLHLKQPFVLRVRESARKPQ